MQEERDKLKEKLLCKKEPGLDLRSVQPLQTAKEDKIRRFLTTEKQKVTQARENGHEVAHRSAIVVGQNDTDAQGPCPNPRTHD